jgi:hypothetical protein
MASRRSSLSTNLKYTKRAGGVAQAVACLPSMQYPSIENKTKHVKVHQGSPLESLTLILCMAVTIISLFYFLLLLLLFLLFSFKFIKFYF